MMTARNSDDRALYAVTTERLYCRERPMSNHQRFLGVLIALTSAWLAACDHHSSGALSPSSPLTTVQITNWEGLQRVPVGWTTPLTAKASFINGTIRDVTTDAAWASSDPSVITVAAGVMVVHGGGRVTLTAAYQGVTASTIIYVTPLATPDLDLWQLTTTVASITGESAGCSARVLSVGSSVNWILGIKRTGSSISFDYDVRNSPTDDTIFTGTVTGSDFVADSTSWNLQIRCSTGKIFNWSSTRVTGRFDQNGRSLTAREIWSWVNAESSDAITVAYDWAATTAAPPG
jgi:hypothetical protein